MAASPSTSARTWASSSAPASGDVAVSRCAQVVARLYGLQLEELNR
ncbi:hypothetical protein [Cellulomonas wangsupingiae]|nr:hypothetical protein [Cellulomonas wangsupingiae]MCM0638947.1 hypothetical protein [Cellulomonas wangsupingiae]